MTGHVQKVEVGVSFLIFVVRTLLMLYPDLGTLWLLCGAPIDHNLSCYAMSRIQLNLPGVAILLLKLDFLALIYKCYSFHFSPLSEFVVFAVNLDGYFC